MEIRKLIIIGGGPAGLSAGVYGGRAKLNPLIFTGIKGKGELALALNVDDFPGFPQGITGLELLELMRQQAVKYGCELKEQEIIKVDFSKQPFKVISQDGKEYLSESVIVATGGRPRVLGLEKEQELIGKGISFCAVCDGCLFQNKKVAVVGGGDVALEDALYLAKYAEKVYLIHRREEFRAAPSLQEEIKNNSKIEVIFENEVVKLLGDNYLEGIIIKNNRSGAEQEIKISGLFLAIGFEPVTDLFQDYLETGEGGYLKVRENVKTSREGIFAAGEVCDNKYRQAITSAAFGAMAALETDRWLREQGHK